MFGPVLAAFMGKNGVVLKVRTFRFDPAPLVNGTDLQRHAAIEPGAELGRILATIRRHQIEGRISNAAAAIDLAVELRQRRKRD